MPYTNNPNMPKIRKEAAQLLVRKKWSTRKVARHFGFNQSTIVRWFKKSKSYGYHPIPTLSSRPKHHPKELSSELVWKIFHQRLKTKRCAEVIKQELENQGINISLSSVKRTLDRTGLTKKRSHLKRYHPPVDRPQALKPGSLVEMDTIHLMTGPKTRMYVFTLIDVHSRWAYAKAYEKMNAKTAVIFLAEAQKLAPFHFEMIQTDHGPEFGSWFVSMIKKLHRFTRIGKPNDNSHIERFNRTLQEECLDKYERKVDILNKALKKYLHYYNTERLHMGIKLKTPIQLITK
jgi:transposase InsO family protein